MVVWKSFYGAVMEGTETGSAAEMKALLFLSYSRQRSHGATRMSGVRGKSVEQAWEGWATRRQWLVSAWCQWGVAQGKSERRSPSLVGQERGRMAVSVAMAEES